MDIIIGGAYQGKLDYAKVTFAVSEEDVFVCSNESCEIDYSKKCIYHIERFALACVREGLVPRETFQIEKCRKDAVVICEDIFCGVVPIDDTLRAWREACGRLMNAITPDAQSVTRIFCGIPQRLK